MRHPDRCDGCPFQAYATTEVGVEYLKYPGLDHDPLVFGSFRDQARWVRDRFEGKPSKVE